MKKIIWAKICY